ncbi:hypothetical protein GCM10022265_38560 [Marinobacter xestospongiae]
MGIVVITACALAFIATLCVLSHAGPDNRHEVSLAWGRATTPLSGS